MLPASLSGRRAAAAATPPPPAAACSRPAALAARRRSHAAACTSGRCLPPALPTPPARASVVAAAAKRGGGGGGRGRGKGGKKGVEEDGDELVDDVLFDEEGEGDDLVGAAEDAEVDAFERFTSDDDDDDLLGDEGAAAAEGEEGEEEEAWDAALDNFDEGQDEKDLAPREPEDPFRAAGLKLARVEASKADSVEVTDITPVDMAPRTDEDRMVTLTAADAARLRSNRAGYTAFKMDGCELLVAETADGMFDLTDTFVFDVKSDLFNRTGTDGPLPPAPARFQCVPWSATVEGNILKMKDPETKVLKMFFVGIARGGEPGAREIDYTLDLEKVYCFDTSTRLLARSVVRRVGEDIQEPILRIRPEGVTLEDVRRAPPPWAILAEDYWHEPVPEPDELGYDPSRHSKEALRAAYEAMTGMSRAEVAEALKAAMAGAGVDGTSDADVITVGEAGAGIEAGGELEGDGYYDMPDVPAVDMM